MVWYSIKKFQIVNIYHGCPPSKPNCGVRGHELEPRPHNLEVPSSIPGSRCQLWDFFIGSHIWCDYWCSSQEAESRDNSISCKNLFLNRCKINMFKLLKHYLNLTTSSLVSRYVTSCECNSSINRLLYTKCVSCQSLVLNFKQKQFVNINDNK